MKLAERQEHMKIGILGRKVGMTQIFDEKGATVPVTVVHVGDCYVSQVKTKQTDGYTAVQLAYGERKPQNVDKARMGHFKKAGVQAKAHLAELRLRDSDDVTQLQVGQTLSASMFQQGDRVDAIGTIKGRGFTGVMKRLGYAGKDATHGTSKYFRHGGSNGTNTFPGRVLKNKGMPGHMGNVPRTCANLEVVGVLPEDGVLLLRGAVPGARNSTVMIRLTKRSMKSEGRTFAPAQA
jgi:large subunit ribosomal protein L3